MKTITVEGQLRKEVGKKATKAIRSAHGVPCVLYGSDQNVHFSAGQKAVKPLIYTPDFQKAAIQVEGKTYTAIVKDLQFHPVTDELLHLDFQELVEGRKVLVELPVRLVGLAKGVRAGGKLLQKMRTVKVKTLPKYLVSEIVVNVDDLELGRSVRVRDIDLGGVEFVTPEATPIASVEITRALRSAAAAAEKAEKTGG